MREAPVALDYAGMMSTHLPFGGIRPEQLDGPIAEAFTRAWRGFEVLSDEGRLGFLDLPYDEETRDQVRRLADARREGVQDVVVLGIGGSALGTIAIREALLGPGWNESARVRGGRPRLHVLDNADPFTAERLLQRLDPATTLFDVVSKSGGTAETVAQYLTARAWVDAAGVDARRAFVFTTGAGAGGLAGVAREEGCATLRVPDAVGGRFSVLSAVGLFPAALAGVDVVRLLEGAAAGLDRCRARVLHDNPAGLLAALLHHADVEGGAPVHVLMPYADRLRAFALWYQQLWAESLGKRTSDGGSVGPTPLPAVGATDQHAQVQLFMEGPADKVVMFVAVADPGAVAPLPVVESEDAALTYLSGRSLAALLDAERCATAEALRRRGRPTMTLELPRIDAYTLGGLFMIFQVATVLAGCMYGVDPLDQPGVELGKELLFGRFGREGYGAPDPRPETGRWRA